MRNNPVGRFALYLLALLLLLALPLIAQADPPGGGCTSPDASNDYHEWVNVEPVPATCTEPGSNLWICQLCKEQYKETVPALGHSWDSGTVTTAATCTTDGVKTLTCSRCGETYTETIPALGHSSVTVAGKAATCTEAGLTEGATCSRCGATLTAQQTIPALGHSPVTVAGKAATCTEAGLTEGATCSRCGATLTAQQTIPALGHSPVTVAGKAATCTEAGLTEGATCSRCGTVITAQQPIAALGHSWNAGAVTTEASCTTPGVKTYTCSRCGATTTEAVPALGHDWDTGTITKQPTCTEEGVKATTCKRCGATSSTEAIPALGHAWDSGTVTANPTCTANGEIVYSCTRCGATWFETLPATGHTPVATSAVEATCTTGGKTSGTQCSVCGAVLAGPQDTPALGHAWNEGTITQYPGCTYEGVKTYTCTRCGATTTETVAAYGHLWDEGVVTKEAGYLEEGEITYTCQRDASHKKTEAIPVKETPDGQSVMSLVRSGGGGITTMKNPVPLMIETQPVGGALSGEGTYELSIGVMGGDKPYTYEWHRVSARLTQQTISILETFGGLVTAIQGKCELASAKVVQMSERNTGWTLTEPAGKITAQLDSDTMIDHAFSIIVGDNSPTCIATAAGTYYCVVRDDNNDEVTSVKVEVGEKLHIIQQPENENLYGEDSVQLTCKAAGGGGPEHYLYNWYDAGGNLLSDENILTTSQEGEYYCQVWDFGADDMVESDIATVYNVDPLWAVATQDDYYIIPGEESTIVEVQFGGGVAPLTGKWMDLNGKILATFTSDITQDQAAAYTATELGTYFLYVTDAMGETRAGMVNVEYRQLKIAQQPEGGMLSEDGTTPVDIRITMAEGETPLTYTFYCNDKNIFTGEGEHVASYLAYQPGNWYIHVEDATGHWADSNVVSVKEYSRVRLHIVAEGDSGLELSYKELNKIGQSVTMNAVAEGGTEPYTYLWRYYEDDSDIYGYGSTNITETGPVYTDSRVGLYQCIVTDDIGEIDINYFTIKYNGTAPVIVHQPESQILPYNEGTKYYSGSLICKAVCSDQNALEYVWQVKIPGENGGWLSGTPTSDTLLLNAIDEHGTYAWRCVVTNTKTGEQAISNEASISVQLVCQNDSTYSGTYAHFSIHGGQPPYVVKEYQRRISIDNELKDGEISYVNILYKTRTINNDKWMDDLLADFQVGDWDWRDNDFYYEYPAYYGGGYIMQSRMADIYIEVLSADGQTVTSSIVENVR